MKAFITADVGLGPRQRDVLAAISALNEALNGGLSSRTEGVSELGVCVRCLPSTARYRKRAVQFSAETRGLFADAVVDGDAVLSDPKADIKTAVLEGIDAALNDIEAFAKRKSIAVDLEPFRSAIGIR